MRPLDSKKIPQWKRNVRLGRLKFKKTMSDPVKYKRWKENQSRGMRRASVRRRLSSAAKKNWKDPEFVLRTMEQRASKGYKEAHVKGAQRMWLRKDRHEKQTTALLKLWKTPEYRRNCVSAMASALGNINGMTSIEKKMNKLLKFLELKYKFVGDGKFVVGKYCPDFVHKRFKWIIETYGSYHHRDRAKNNKRNEFIRRQGYKLLVIWDYELKDLDKVMLKIHKFHLKNLGRA